MLTVAQPTRADWAVVTGPMSMDAGMFCAHSRTSNSGLSATFSLSCGEMPYVRAKSPGPCSP
ncbi:hypothetical protein ACWGKA_22610 [Streptomyces luteogriseus]